MAYDQAAADWQRKAEQAQQRVTAALADLAVLEGKHFAYRPADVDLDTCAGCSIGMEIVLWPCETSKAAARLRATLNGEDT